MSTDKPTPKKHIDGGLIREHIFRELGVNVDALRHDQTAARPSQATTQQPARPSTGYKNPPLETRFEKGRSGNPKGRPKKPKAKDKRSSSPAMLEDTHQLLLNHFATPMKVREGNGVRDVARPLAYIKMIEQQAAAGGVLAARTLFDLSQRLAQEETEAIARSAADMKEYIANFNTLSARARNGGDPIPDDWIHPEDIIIEPGRPVRILGYHDEKSYAECLKIKNMRDSLIIRMVYDNAFFFCKSGSKTNLTVADLMVFMLDRFLPRRWRSDSVEVQGQMDLLVWASRPRLRQRLKDAFDAQGWPLDQKAPAPFVSDPIYRALGFDPKTLKQQIENVKTRQRGKAA